jgi:hypothetical protein
MSACGYELQQKKNSIIQHQKAVLLEEIKVPQLINIFPIFHGT